MKFDPEESRHHEIEIGDVSCETASKTVDLINVSVDSCSRGLSGDPIEILSQDGISVTFSVFQDYNSDWIATDFVGLDNEMKCVKSIDFGSFEQITASCIDGVSMVDFYISGESYGQIDGLTMVIPKACDEVGDSLSLCHFRYVLKCLPSKCLNHIEAKDKSLRRGSSLVVEK